MILLLILMIFPVTAVFAEESVTEELRKARDEWYSATHAPDPVNTGFSLGYANADFNDRKWKKMHLPCHWERAGLDMDGVVWFRKTVKLPKTWAGRDLVLSLGAIDDQDTTYFNGRRVGATGYETADPWKQQRSYNIPAELVKPGKNTIAVRVFDHYLDGGMWGPEEMMYLSGPGMKKRKSIYGKWKYFIETETERKYLKMENPAAVRKFDELARFGQEDRNNPPEKGIILFTGSSSITKWQSLPEDMAPFKVLNRGFGGSRASDVLANMENVVLRHEPRTIVFYEGDNDLAGGLSPEEFLADCREFVRTVHERLPETRIYLLSIKPSPSRISLWKKMQEANSLLEKFAGEQEYLGYIDITRPMLSGITKKPKKDIFSEDMLHMNRKGYDMWTAIIKKRLQDDGR